MAGMPDRCQESRRVELPARADRERLIVTFAEAAYHNRSGWLVADEPDQWDVEDARDLLDDDGHEAVGRRLVGDEGCDLPQGACSSASSRRWFSARFVAEMSRSAP